MSRVVVAFDSFKGSLDADAACAVAATAIRAALPHVEVLERPMADGGEGSVDLVARLLGGDRVTVATTDAIGRPIDASYVLVDDEACIEVAAACGLPQVQDVPLQPLDASTRGVGRLVVDALDRGAQRVTLLLGGSATTDGGAGILAALGASLLDERGDAIADGGRGLAELARVDLGAVDPRAVAATWTFVTDVDAPLTGPTGAAAVFGPQKGATSEQVVLLDGALDRLARLAADALDVEVGDVASRAGAGAAGGIASVLAPLVGGTTLAGSRWFAEHVELEAAIEGADLVLTGEGRFDDQSVGGKVFTEVAAAAARHAVPIAVIAGSVAAAVPVPAFSIAAGPAELSALQRDAGPLLARTAASVARLALAAR